MVGVATAGLLGTVIAVPCASAAFTRPFIRQIAGVPTGPLLESEVPFGGLEGAAGGPGAIAVDAEADVWVANGGLGSSTDELDEYDSAGHFLKAIQLKATQVTPQSLAVSYETGNLYIAGEAHGGARRVEVLEPDGKVVSSSFPAFGPRIVVAVDNSTDASAGDVYVGTKGEVESELHAAVPGAIYKYTATGTPAAFAETKRDEIPGGEFTGLAVDHAGVLYAIDVNPTNGPSPEPATLEEFGGGGVHLRSITPQDAQEWNGGTALGVGFDPVAGHVLVAVTTFDAGFVDEFDASGKLVSTLSDVTAPSALPTSCGIARGSSLGSAVQVAGSALGVVYVSDETAAPAGKLLSCEHALDSYGVGKFLPSVTLGEASEQTTTTAVVNGAVNPEGQPLVECEFQYVSEAAFATTGFTDLSSGGQVPCVPGAGTITGTSFTAVHAGLSGLLEGTVYRYRLVATSSGSSGGTADTAALAFTALARPVVDSTTAAGVSSAGVGLRAQIDPRGANTSYYFEYVDEAQYDAGAEDPYTAGVRVPVAPAEIGAGGPTGSADASVLQRVGGLSPDTSYRFRVVASNEVGVTDGPGGSFATLAAPLAGLPDHRVYELVTPPDKGGSADLFGSAEQFSNPDGGFPSSTGDEFLMPNTIAAFGPSPGSDANAYVFKREASGWRTIPAAEPSLGVQAVMTRVFDPVDLSRVGLIDEVGSFSSAGGASAMSLVGPPGGPYATVHADAPVNVDQEHTQLVGASQNLGHVILESVDHGLAAPPGAEAQDPGSHALYEWAGGGECGTEEGNCKLVNANSEGTLLSRCGAVLGQGHIMGSRRNAVSADGSRVIFTAPDPYAVGHGAECWNGATLNSPELYLRADGATLEVSEVEAGVSEEGKEPRVFPAVYVGASEDDSRVFFVTKTEITKEAATLKLHDFELYECQVVEVAGAPACHITRVSAGDPGSPAAGVFTVPAVSASGAAVYFTASGQLVPGAPAPGGEEVDLYRYDTESGETTYVATVDRHDYSKAEASQWAGEFGQNALAEEANWYSTPDGAFLVFASGRQLTSYSTVAAPGAECPFEAKGGGSGLVGHCAEIYRFDAADGTITCVSCNPSGAPPVSNAQIVRRSFSEVPAGAPVYPISNDGSYVFFDTADALVPQDSNDTLDVYEWHQGAVALISSGTDLAPSYFLGASPDGANVFIGTHAQLVRQDKDTSGDVYDARIGGGFPGGPEGESQCTGESCQNPPAAPIDATPGSATFVGPGNVPAAGAGSSGPGKPKKTAAQLRAEKLAHALKLCRAKRSRAKRSSCEAAARRRYGKKAAGSSKSAARGGR